jgi:hypothetical protein
LALVCGLSAGQPDIGALFAKLAASTSYPEFSELVRQAQGSAGPAQNVQSLHR